jgi:oligo-1,6-glucosidase
MLDMVFQFEHVGIDQGNGKWDELPFDLFKLISSLSQWQKEIGSTGWNSLYWNNHDQPRIVSRWGNDSEFRELSAKMLGAVLHMHRGTPYVYQGEELGMTNFPFTSIAQFQDLETLNHYSQAKQQGVSDEELLRGYRKFGRDNARTPMQWDQSLHAGFTSGTPWLEVNPNYLSINAEAAVAQRDSVFHFYRRLIAMRKSDPVIAFGDYTLLAADDPHIYCFARRLDTDGILTIANFSNESRSIDLPTDLMPKAVSYIHNYPTAPELSPTTELCPWEVLVYRWSNN